MRVVNKGFGKAADVSAERGSAFSELGRLLLIAVLLAAGVYVSVGFVVDAAVGRISFETEANLFGADIFSPPGNGDENSQPRREQAILDRLVSGPRVPPLPYRIISIQEEKPNAFAFPGGTIGITEGLMKTLDEEVALAFVLGHELGHFYHRDHLRGAGRAIGAGILFSILFGGQMGNDAVGSVFNAVLSRNYSRGQEVEADRYGVELVYRVYGRTDGVDRLFTILEEKEDLPGWAYMFTTHPSPGSRILDLREHMEKLVSGSSPEDERIAPRL